MFTVHINIISKYFGPVADLLVASELFKFPLYAVTSCTVVGIAGWCES